jgi:hypothetical protein
MNARLILILLLGMLPIQAVYAQDCSAVLAELRGFTSPAYAEYSELAQVRQDTLLLLYSRERASCDRELVSFASSALEYLRAMHGAYLLLSSPELESQREGIARAIEAEKFISSMRNSGSALGILASDAVLAAEQGRENLLLSQGMVFENRAEAAENTRAKLDYLALAIASYEAADSLQAKSLEVRRQSLEEKYIADIARAAQYMSRAQLQLAHAQELSTTFPGFVDAYSLAREARINLARARELYRLHSEAEKLAQVEESYSRAEEIYSTTRRKILFLFAITAAALTSLSVYIQNRILGWEKDTYDCYLGNELVGK